MNSNPFEPQPIGNNRYIQRIDPSKIGSNPFEAQYSSTKTLKVDVRVWTSLKNLKKENETFSDVIKDLLNERTKSVGNDQVKAIKYIRKVLFLDTGYKYISVGIEFGYNDVKNQQQDFTLDLTIKKIFYGKRILNPSVFLGLDDSHKHLSLGYLNLYLKCVAFALKKEFRVSTGMIFDDDFENIVKWRKVYYDYSLSEESFINDIEEPLRLSEEEKLSEKDKDSINNSVSASIWGKI